MLAASSSTLNKFHQEDHKGSALQAFQDFVESYAYEYDAIAKEPPKELVADAKAAWVEQNKRKIWQICFA